MLLRLKPGPDESLFGITAAPTIAVADFFGRILVPNLNLRGDIPAACRRMEQALASFDAAKAARPPYGPPPFAAPLLEPDGVEAMERFLAAAHPATGGKPPRGKAFADLAEVYRSLELDGQLVRFCGNYFAAVGRRAAHLRAGAGPDEEAALLEEMTYCRNDRVKFEAIAAFAKCAPPARASFFARRVAEKTKDCLNPNRVLCACVDGVGFMAMRLPDVTDRASAEAREAVLGALPLLVATLDAEARNNGACRMARDAAWKVALATGAPEALEAFLHALKAPGVNTEWLRDMTEKFRAETHRLLTERTGASPGDDYESFARWYAARKNTLFFDRAAGKFIESPAAAKAFRGKLAAALRER
ncbi:MAG: hypothetical protein MUE73_06955 [Planctomycetes bacterium]|nr:hypothetical protein [Planctomycetota bacterium]